MKRFLTLLLLAVAPLCTAGTTSTTITVNLPNDCENATALGQLVTPITTYQIWLDSTAPYNLLDATLVEEIASSATTYTYTGLTPATDYAVGFSCKDAAGNSQYLSPPFPVTTDAAAASDWAARSTAPGVLMATRFDTEAEISNWTDEWNDGSGHLEWEQSIVSSGNGALRFNILKTDGQGSGQWRRWLSDDQRQFDTGDEFYVSYRMYIDAYRITHNFAGGGGWKTSITSRAANNMNGELQSGEIGSNQLNEVVIQNNNQWGFIQGYNRNHYAEYRGWYTGLSTPCSGSDFQRQNKVDNGVQTGGTACENYRAQYGPLFSQSVSGGGPGHPDPLSGGFRWPQNQWFTILQRVKVGTYNDADPGDHEVQVSAALDGQPWVELIEYTDRMFASSAPLHDTLWLLPYHTNQQPEPGREDTFVVYDEVIVSTDPIAAPGTSPGGTFAAVPAETWYEIPNTEFDSAAGQCPTGPCANIDPCPTDDCGYQGNFGQNGVFIVWNGGAYDTVNDKLVVMGGGHNGYGGNEVYSFDLQDAEWTRHTDPYDVDAGSTEIPDGKTDLYPDGTPRSRHTYDYLSFNPVTNEFLVLGASGPWSTGNSTGGFVDPRVLALDMATGTWDTDGPLLPLAGNPIATSAYDPVSGKHYVQRPQSGSFFSYDRSTDTLVDFGTLGSNDIDMSSAISPDHRLLLMVGNAGGVLRQFEYDLTQDPPTRASVYDTVNGDKGCLSSQVGKAVIEYSTVDQVFVCWPGSGRDVYTYDPDTSTWARITVASGPTPPADDSIVPGEGAGNVDMKGTYGRFRYSPIENVFVLAANPGYPVMIFKLSN